MPMPFTTRRREMLQATAIGVAALPKGSQVEMDAILVIE